jgi:hypothetical protein
LSQLRIALRASFPRGKADQARSALIKNGRAEITKRKRSRAAGSAGLKPASP